VYWTRSRAYKKNDQTHVEQKNFTHVRQLLGYGRYDDIRLVELVNGLYETAWLPLRNHFTPVMKLVEKKRVGSKVRKKYDVAKTPCDRLLDCPHVSGSQKEKLREQRAMLDPLELSELLEEKLVPIFEITQSIEERRAEEDLWISQAEEESPQAAPAGAGCVSAAVANAPCASTSPAPAESLAKSRIKKPKTNQLRVS
jgi:hypothetical protein